MFVSTRLWTSTHTLLGKSPNFFPCLFITIRNLWGIKISWNGQIWPPHLCILCFRAFLDVCTTNNWICIFIKKFDPYQPADLFLTPSLKCLGDNQSWPIAQSKWRRVRARNTLPKLPSKAQQQQANTQYKPPQKKLRKNWESWRKTAKVEEKFSQKHINNQPP